ncbi:MAG: dipeptidase [Acidobacteriota bacterium]|jgi:membrane dipeptidase|nr:dipeptidase [Acidobacteriota bacterium]
MRRFWFEVAATTVAALFAIAPGWAQGGGRAGDADGAALVEKARKIHDAVITLDTHIDIDTRNFTREVNYTQDLPTQVNLPKMERGGLDVAWFVVYTGQGALDEEGYRKAYANAIDKFDAIDRLTKEIAPERIELALTSDDVRRIHKSGKKVAMIGVENAYPVGEDLGRVKYFAQRGARYISLTHNGHSQFADSNTGERDDVWLHGGLSELGKDVVREANKWGLLLDLSHPGKQANIQTLQLSKAPVIASHSGARALCDNSRNLSDEELDLLKANGGVVQAVAFRSYVNQDKNALHSKATNEILQELAKEEGFQLRGGFGPGGGPPPGGAKPPAGERLSEAERGKYIEELTAFRNRVKPRLEQRIKERGVDAPDVNVRDFVDHIDYLVKKVGIDHVGISSDFDGGGGVEGWDDASETFNVTLELVRRGYTEEQIAKLWSGNLLRVLDEAQAVALRLQRE